MDKKHARIDAEVRAVARKLAHRPDHEVAQYLRERLNVRVDPDRLAEILREARTNA